MALLTWVIYNVTYSSTDDGSTATGLDWYHYGNASGSRPSKYRGKPEVIRNKYRYVGVNDPEIEVNAVGGETIVIIGTFVDNVGGTYTADGAVSKLETMRDSKEKFTLICPDFSSGVTVIIADVDAPQDATIGISLGRSTRTYGLTLEVTS